MARTRRENAEEARQALLDAAERFVGIRRDAVVIVAHGMVEVVRPHPGGRPAAAEPGEVSSSELAILRTLTDTPQSARRLARLAGRRHNSYFRSQLGRLVDDGRIRRTRRGYVRP